MKSSSPSKIKPRGIPRRRYLATVAQLDADNAKTLAKITAGVSAMAGAVGAFRAATLCHCKGGGRCRRCSIAAEAMVAAQYLEDTAKEVFARRGR